MGLPRRRSICPANRELQSETFPPAVVCRHLVCTPYRESSCLTREQLLASSMQWPMPAQVGTGNSATLLLQLL